MRLLSLCTGYGGLEISLSSAGIPAELIAVADPDPAAAKVLAHHYPAIPNLGDITKQAWTDLGPIDIVCAGYPCQGFSHAGQRKGIEDERFIWPSIADAIRVLRPRRVLLENVAGHRSLGFGRVLGDLAALGYDARWVSVRASDVGAAHRRERVLILAHPADAEGVGHGHTWTAGGPRIPAAPFPDSDHSLVPTPGARLGRATSIRPATAARRLTEQRKQNLDDWAALLPTPRASANENRQTKRTPSQEAGTHGRNLAAEVCSLLPTPRASDGTKGGPNQHGSSGDLTLPQPGRWGKYAAAIDRWEQILGRPSPEPTEPGADRARSRDAVRLSPRFVEWLMGLPDGWVCDVPGLSRNDMLRLLGNGVVWQQAAYAIDSLHNIA